MNISWSDIFSDWESDKYYACAVAVLALLGTAVPVYFEYRKKKREKRRDISWSELEDAVIQLAHPVHRFGPDVMFACDSRGGLWADLLAETMNLKPHVLIGNRFRHRRLNILREGHRKIIVQVGERLKKDGAESYRRFFFDETHVHVETARWDLYIPRSLMLFNRKKLLLVDDYSFTGETMHVVRETLIGPEFGF